MPQGIFNSRTTIQSQTKFLTESFCDETNGVPPLWKSVFNTPESFDKRRSFMTVLPLAGLGSTVFKPEGAAPNYDQPYELIPYTVTFFTYALAVKATEEGELEDPENMLGEIPGELAKVSRETKDLVVWNTINLGFQSNVLYSDGQPLFSANHPLAPIATPTGVVSSVGATQSNLLAGLALTVEAVQQADIMFETTLTERGMPDRRTPRLLMVPTALDKVAKEIVGSSHAPFSGDNKINVQHQGKEVLTNRYLTSASAWFVLGNQGNPFKGGDHHHLFVAHKWESKFKVWTDDETGNYNQKVSDRYTFGSAGYRGLVGSSGSAGNL
jgi:hypothetical protein